MLTVLLILILNLVPAVIAILRLPHMTKYKFTQLNYVCLFILVLTSIVWLQYPLYFSLTLFKFASINFSIDLQFDQLTWVMLCLISFISLIIHSYSIRYLASDDNQSRFMMQLALLKFSVTLLVLGGSLLTVFLAWQFIGIMLYILLNHYHFKAEANKAAKKKFMINRIGDVCFLAAVIIILQHYGTSQFAVLYHAKSSDVLYVALGLVFVAVMTKSAQFPFHIWLIDTMEAPTPISALMHAGIINAGGFLLARLSPWYSNYPSLMFWIFLIGFSTALLGKFFMFTQVDVKRKLAYSTMGQMGYMVMQCGLGCFASAVFHLIAHGFFKSSLFLHSGSDIKKQRVFHNSNMSLLERKPSLRLFTTAILTGCYLLVGVVLIEFFKLKFNLNIFLWFFVTVTLFQMIYTFLKRTDNKKVLLFNLLVLAVMYFTYLFLLADFISFTANVAQESSAALFGKIMLVVALVGIIIYFIVTKFVPQESKKQFYQFLYMLSFSKGNIESIFRKYILNPIRLVGDKINVILSKLTKNQFAFILATMMFLILFVSFEFNTSLLISDSLLQNIMLWTMVSALTLVLIIANRVDNLVKLSVALFFTAFLLLNLGYYINNKLIHILSIYYFINISVILLVFNHVYKNKINSSNTQVQTNRLLNIDFYLAVLLLFLIGIPGTASFIGEFYLLESLLSINLALAGLFMVTIILLSMVVLHAIQMHFFHPLNSKKGVVNLSVTNHLIIGVALLFNIINGIYPNLMLTIISFITR